jgi:tetratricopeptide (TPR) repeat protein
MLIDKDNSLRGPAPVFAGSLEAGITAFQQGKYDLALAHLNEAIRSNPHKGEAYYYRGQSYQAMGEYHKAIAPTTSTGMIQGILFHISSMTGVDHDAPSLGA